MRTTILSAWVVLLWVSIALPVDKVSGTDKDRFVPFYWSGFGIAGSYYPKATLLVPIKVEGSNKQFYAQLDTGTETSVLYGIRLLRHGFAVDSGRVVGRNVSWYDKDSEIRSCTAYVVWSMEATDDTGSADSLVGSIGLDALYDRILVIDYPRTRFAVFRDTADLPDNIKRSVGYVPAEIQYNMLYVTVVLGDDTLKSVLFDTGSSTTTLLLPEREWMKITGLSGDEAVVVRDSVPAWGGYLPLLRGPSRYSLSFGSILIDNPTVDHVKWPGGANDNLRLMGNALFYNDYLVVIDFGNRQFGIMKSN